MCTIGGILTGTKHLMGRFVVDIKYHGNVGWPLIRKISV